MKLVQILEDTGINKGVIVTKSGFTKDYNVEKTKASFQKAEKIIRLPQASNIVMREELNEFVAKNWNSRLV